MLEHLYDDLPVIEENAYKLNDEERIRQSAPVLLRWFGDHARILPWRENPAPYRVWLSEIMLQQTRVEAVKPYFERFLAEVPDIATLAVLPEERLLKLWEGLGYYNRARNLVKAAKMIMDEYHGVMPADYEKLLELPGIGSYTAGAVASIAYGIRVPAVDGNVLRVISRLLASREDIMKPGVKKQMEMLLARTIPGDRPGDFNQALMEVGATVCIPRGEPRCTQCPFRTLCLANRYKLTGEIPVKTAAKARKIEERTVLLVHSRERIMLVKRPDKGLLAGMYEFPNLEGYMTTEQIAEWVQKTLKIRPEKQPVITRLADAKHIFSHIEWHMRGFLVELEAPVSSESLVEISRLQETYAIPNAYKTYYAELNRMLSENG